MKKILGIGIGVFIYDFLIHSEIDYIIAVSML